MIIRNSLKVAVIAITILTVGCVNLTKQKELSISEQQIKRHDLIYGGIDNNKNGVRDDVEVYIKTSYQKEYSKVLFDISNTIRNDMMTNGLGDSYYTNYLKDIVNHRHCINKIDKLLSQDNARKYFLDIYDLHADTQLRYEKINSTSDKVMKLSPEAVELIMSDLKNDGFNSCN